MPLTGTKVCVEGSWAGPAVTRSRYRSCRGDSSGSEEVAEEDGESAMLGRVIVTVSREGWVSVDESA